MVAGSSKAAGVGCVLLATWRARHAAITTAVVHASVHIRPVNVVAQEAHQYLMPDARDELVAHAWPREALHHPHPATVVAVGALRRIRVGLPMLISAGRTRDGGNALEREHNGLNMPSENIRNQQAVRAIKRQVQGISIRW